ncbi:MAG: HEPN domain-containing protein [Desulfosalsimonadaceae bacterium]
MKDNDKQILINYRIQQARAALEEADVLFSLSKTTFGAVNRAYYAMFYSVLAILQHIDKVPRKHSGAIALFDSEFVKKGIFPKELSRNLHNAFESRQTSDYLAATPICREDAEEIIQNAIAFLKTIEKYLQDACLE